MEEVIVKKRGGVGGAYIFVALMGVALIAMGIVIGTEETGALIMGVLVGVIILAMGVYKTVYYYRLPKNLVVFKDGVLYLPKNVTCKPEELDNVFVKVYRGRYGSVSRHGKMEITVRGTVYKYSDVADVQPAQARLMELKNFAVMQMQQPAAEAQPSDPFGEI